MRNTTFLNKYFSFSFKYLKKKNMDNPIKELPICEEFCDNFHQASLDSIEKMKQGIKPRFIKLA